MSSWTQLVNEYRYELASDNSLQARALLALYDLVVIYEAGGLVSYLMGSAADSANDLAQYFSEQGFAPGLHLLASVSSKCPLALSPDRDLRIDSISELPGFDAGDDPLEAEDRSLSAMLPQIEAMADGLALRLRQAVARAG